MSKDSDSAGLQQTFDEPVELWVCHDCKMIGTFVQAKAHHIARGHEVEPLDRETATAIYEEWRRTGDPRAA